MKKLPEFIPEYKIETSAKAPFSVKWEELMGWFLIPKLGERLSWGMYDIPSRKCSHVYDMQVTGKAKVHGIEGVELTAREASYSDKNEVINRTFVAQLTDTHCRFVSAIIFSKSPVQHKFIAVKERDVIANISIISERCKVTTMCICKLCYKSTVNHLVLI